MIEALTPLGLAYALWFIVLLAPLLALALALLLLALYRRAVLRAMSRSATPSATPHPAATERANAAAPVADPGLHASLLSGRRRAIARICLAGLAYALTVAVAAAIANESMRTPLGFALAAWAATWPVVPALWIAAPAGARAGLVAAGVYLLPLLAIIATAFVAPEADVDLLADPTAAIRAGWSPPELIVMWLRFAILPTVLLMLVLNRWTRAVGPLVLAFATLLLVGLALAFFVAFSAAGVGAVESAMRLSGLPARTVVLAMVLASGLAALALGAVAAWLVLRRIRAGYLGKRSNDRSLTLDGVWLVFAAFHAMLFALAGLAWTAVGALAFLVFRAVLRRIPLAAPTPTKARPAGLVFLRVFSLGRRTEKLFDGLSRYWRHCGSVQLITGPDLARSTVQPHQMLDFVSGQLARHFVADAASLRNQIAALDRAPDHDGLYRINSLFCHADTWQAALAALVGQGDRVLMDLRSFSASNAGCTTEIRHLVHHVPLTRCLWVIDADTDREFLARTLHDAWATMPADSPNAGSSADAAPLYPITGGWHGIGPLLRRLAATA